MSKTPEEWKVFYREERARLDLRAMLERAPRVKCPVIFPHTRAEVTGTFVAAAAKAVADSGAEEVSSGDRRAARKSIARSKGASSG